jgi:hypothetical protein
MMSEAGPSLNGCDDGGYMKGFVVFCFAFTVFKCIVLPALYTNEANGSRKVSF